ncbi:MAG: CHAP domain-containing protein [Gaiellaceae bacterium]
MARKLFVLTLASSVVLCAGAAARPHARAEGDRESALRIHGYLYASRCPEAGPEEIVDRWGMYLCNCTSYVAWALHANGQRTGWFIRGSMDAWNWPNVARRRGLRVVDTPRVREVAVWPKLGRPFGHVAYVTRVRDDGTFDVAEYNLPGKPAHRFRFDVRRSVSRRGATFIEVPERQ